MKIEWKKRFCLPPCPDWDVPGTEAWLTEMAAQGWHLGEAGFFLGFAWFEKGAPKPVRYRLTAAQKQAGSLSETDSPDEEEQDVAAALGWEYAGRRGQFYIYRTEDADARELNTDDAVQALALKTVKKRKMSSLISEFIWLIVYPLIISRGGVILKMLALRTWLFLLLTAAVLWFFLDALRAVVGLSRMQKSLQRGEETPPTQRRRWRHPAKNIAQAALVVFLVCILLSRWSDRVMDKGEIPLADSTAEMPFATLLELAGEGATGYQVTVPKYSHVREWADILAPRSIDYAEQAVVTQADGNVLDGGLYVYYHETAAPWIARLLAQEYIRADRRDRHYEPLDVPLPDADFAFACRTSMHIPTVILQEGSTVVRVFFLQSGGGEKIPTEVWAAQFAESIR